MTTVIGQGDLYYFKQGLWRSLRPWTPADITTELWLDGSDASTVVLNGSTVSRWNDKSGNGRNGIQTAAALQPAYTANGLNNKSVLTFAADRLELPSDVVRSPTTIGIVYKFSSFTQANPRLYDFKKSSESLQLIRDGATADVATKNTVYQPLGSQGTKWHGSQTTDPELIVVDFGDAATDLYLDGTASTSTGSVGIGAAGTDSTIGVRADFNNTTYLYGYIAEIVIASGILSTQNRQVLEGYLAHKWDLTSSLPATHPYKTVEP